MISKSSNYLIRSVWLASIEEGDSVINTTLLSSEMLCLSLAFSTLEWNLMFSISIQTLTQINIFCVTHWTCCILPGLVNEQKTVVLSTKSPVLYKFQWRSTEHILVCGERSVVITSANHEIVLSQVNLEGAKSVRPLHLEEHGERWVQVLRCFLFVYVYCISHVWLLLQGQRTVLYWGDWVPVYTSFGGSWGL